MLTWPQSCWPARSLLTNFLRCHQGSSQDKTFTHGREFRTRGNACESIIVIGQREGAKNVCRRVRISSMMKLYVKCFIKISVKHDTSAKFKNKDVKDIDKKSHLHSYIINKDFDKKVEEVEIVE